MADDGNLSAEQTDKLIYFQVNEENCLHRTKFIHQFLFNYLIITKEITHIDSIEECKQILEAFSWNIEVNSI
jgi:hypothetical protein